MHLYLALKFHPCIISVPGNSAGLTYNVKKGISFPITFNHDSSKDNNLHLPKSFHLPFLHKDILITI